MKCRLGHTEMILQSQELYVSGHKLMDRAFQDRGHQQRRSRRWLYTLKTTIYTQLAASQGFDAKAVQHDAVMDSLRKQIRPFPAILSDRQRQRLTDLRTTA